MKFITRFKTSADFMKNLDVLSDLNVYIYSISEPEKGIPSVGKKPSLARFVIIAKTNWEGQTKGGLTWKFVEQTADGNYKLEAYGISFSFNQTNIVSSYKLDVNNKMTTLYAAFNGCSQLVTLNTSNWKTSNIIDMAGLFNNCPQLNSLDTSKWDTSKVTDMRYMFNQCSKLNSLDTSKWDTSNVTSMRAMYQSCSSLDIIDTSNWDTSKVTDMAYMFNKCSLLQSIDTSKWNTSNVTSMTTMFQTCSSLDMIDISKWNTSKVTDMSYMFNKCYKLNSLDPSKWNTSNVTNMSYMFSQCSKLNSLDTSNWDTSNVTSMKAMFQLCSSLDIIDTSNWDTSKVTDMSFMFSSSFNVNNLNVSNWRLPNVTSLYAIFAGSNDDGYFSKITDLDVSNWGCTSKLTNMEWAFSGLNKIKTLDFSKWDFNGVPSFLNCFRNDESVESILLPKHTSGTLVSINRMFNGCNSLKTLDLSGWNVTNVTDIEFGIHFCHKLTDLDLSGWHLTKMIGKSQRFLEGCESLKTIRMIGCDEDTINFIKGKLGQMGTPTIEQITIITE